MPSLRSFVFPAQSSYVDELIAAARAAAARKRARALKRRNADPSRPQLTLRPGPDTPLWNELVRQVCPHLKKRGAKAQLARLLGLPRQRLQDCLKSGRSSFDAERTLMLLGWLTFFERGGEIHPVVRCDPSVKPGKAPVPPGSL